MVKRILMLVFAILGIVSDSICMAYPMGKDIDDNGEQLTMKKIKEKDVDKLAAKETDKMRAVGMSNDYDEMDARIDAISEAQSVLAAFLETSIISLTQKYRKKEKVNNKVLSRSGLESLVELAVAQNVSCHMVDKPEVYAVSDGTIQVYVCVELDKTTKEVIGDIYDKMAEDDVFDNDDDDEKHNFIQENIDRINELRNLVKRNE